MSKLKNAQITDFGYGIAINAHNSHDLRGLNHTHTTHKRYAVTAVPIKIEERS